MTEQDDTAWLDAQVDGWTPVTLPTALSQESFVSGDSSGRRLRVRYFQLDEDRTLRAKALFGPGTQGPPGHAHGGSMAALLDEALGGAAWMHGHQSVAAELNTRFRMMLPIGVRCVVCARICSVEGRKVRVEGSLKGLDGKVYAEADALFVTLDFAKFGVPADLITRMFARPVGTV